MPRLRTLFPSQSLSIIIPNELHGCVAKEAVVPASLRLNLAKKRFRFSDIWIGSEMTVLGQGNPLCVPPGCAGVGIVPRWIMVLAHAVLPLWSSFRAMCVVPSSFGNSGKPFLGFRRLRCPFQHPCPSSLVAQNGILFVLLDGVTGV